MRYQVRVPDVHKPLFGMTPAQQVFSYPSTARADAAQHRSFIAACEADATLRARIIAAGGLRALLRPVSAAVPVETAPAPDHVSALLLIYIAKKKPRRTDKYRAACKSFCAFLNEPRDYRTVTPQMVDGWRESMEREGASWYVVRDNLRALSCMFALVRLEMPGRRNPCEGITPQIAKPDMKGRARAKTPLLADRLALITEAHKGEWAGKRNEAATLALEGLIHSGCRPHEFLQIEPLDIRLTKHGVVVTITDKDARASYRARHARKHLKRPEHERELPLVGDASNFGQRLLAFAQANADRAQLFDTFRWDPVREDYVSGFGELFRVLRTKADVPDTITPYGFRHAYRTATRNAGIPRDHSLYLCGRAGDALHDGLYGSPAELAQIAKSAEKVSALSDYGAT